LPQKPSEAELPPVISATPLAAGTATAILLIYVVIQLAAGVVVGATAAALSADETNFADPNHQEQLIERMFGPAILAALLGGGMAMFLMSVLLVRQHLRDNSPLGAAWLVGSFKAIAQGLATGVGTALLYVGLCVAFAPRDPEATLGPMARMAVTPGSSQIMWLIAALALAPPIEECLFRGVLYGGYRKSLGPFWAAFITTGIFLLLHITEVIHFWPAILGIAGLGLVALVFRLRSGAIGPAVAVHFGYNAVMALWAILATTLG